MAPSHDRRVSLQNELERIRQLVCETLEGYQARIYLFGSHARGEAHRFSDVELLSFPSNLSRPPSLQPWARCWKERHPCHG